MTLRLPIDCTCGTRPHAVECLITAANTPHAMVNEAGEVFYPDSPEDALLFAVDHGAEFLHSDFRWSSVDCVEPAPLISVTHALDARTPPPCCGGGC